MLYVCSRGNDINTYRKHSLCFVSSFAKRITMVVSYLQKSKKACRRKLTPRMRKPSRRYVLAVSKSISSQPKNLIPFPAFFLRAICQPKGSRENQSKVPNQGVKNLYSSLTPSPSGLLLLPLPALPPVPLLPLVNSPSPFLGGGLTNAKSTDIV